MEQQQQQSSPHSDIILDCNDDSLPSEESLSYFRTYGHYIPEFYFLNEICFNSNEFEPYMNLTITSLFFEESKQFIAIETPYLKSNGDHRKEIHSYVEEKFPSLTSFSTEGKEYLIICTKEIESSLKPQLPSLKKVFQYTLDQMLLQRLNDLKSNEEIREEMSLEEIEERKRKEEIRLPQLNTCEFIEITHNTCTITVNEIKREVIVNRNKNMPYNFSFLKNYGSSEMNYVLFLYEHTTQTYKKIQHNEIKNGKVYFTLSNLQSNQLYMFKLSFQYERFYSLPEHNFYFYTNASPSSTSSKLFIAYGNNKNHRLLLNSQQIDLSLVNNNNTNINDVIIDTPFEDCYIKSPLPLAIPITSFAIHDMQTLITLTTGQVINSGKCIVSSLTEDGSFSEANSNSEHLNQYYSELPYEISFPSKIYIRKVTLGQEHCIALSNMGHCYSWGSNWCGQLGLGIEMTKTVGIPKKIEFTIENTKNIFITDIQSGANHSLALGIYKTKSVLFFFGLGQGPHIPLYSQMYPGLRLPTCSSLPIELSFENTDHIIKLYAKYNTNSIICKDVNKGINILYNFGINTSYQLGFYNNLSDKQVNWDLPSLVEVFVYKGLSVVDVKFCENYSLVLVEDGNGKRMFYVSGLLPYQKEVIKCYEEMSCEFNVNDVRGFAVNKQQMYFYMKNNEVFVLDNNRVLSMIQLKYVKLNKVEYKYGNIHIESVDDNFVLSIQDANEIVPSI